MKLLAIAILLTCCIGCSNGNSRPTYLYTIKVNGKDTISVAGKGTPYLWDHDLLVDQRVYTECHSFSILKIDTLP